MNLEPWMVPGIGGKKPNEPVAESPQQVKFGGDLAHSGSMGTSGPVDSDPFAGIGQELERSDSAPGVSWFTAMRAVAKELAHAWFDLPDYGSQENWVRSELGDEGFSSVDFLYRALPGFADDPVSPSVFAGRQSLGESISLEESSLWKSLGGYLTERGMKGVEFPGLAANGLVIDAGIPFTWVGSWGTEFGTRTLTRIEIRRSPDGKESAYVHTHMAVATRRPKPALLPYSKLGPLAQFALPMMFVAESPLPSAIFSSSRQLAYPDVPPELWPKPLVSVDESIIASFVLPNSANTPTIDLQNQVFPLVASAGFVLTEEHIGPHFPTVVNSVIDTLTNLATVVEDGFRNYRNKETPIPFDSVFGSEYTILGNEEDGQVEGVTAGGMSRWIAETHLGSLAGATYERLHLLTSNAITGDDFDAAAYWILDEGAGTGVSQAMNFIVEDHLIPLEDWAMVERLSNTVLGLDTPFEAPRALYNLGFAYVKAGIPDEAKKCLVEAIERPDCTIEAQACLLLGEIATESGLPEEARQWFERGSSVVSDGQEEFARRCAEKLKDGL